MWQRDALRRIVLNVDLSDKDITPLTAICKSAHGLAVQQETNPLTKEQSLCGTPRPYIHHERNIETVI